MINVPVQEVMEHWEATLKRPLHASRTEWEYFCSVNGPFTKEDWNKMPNLYKELTR